MGDLGLSSTFAVGAMQQSVRQRIMDALARQQQQFKNDMDVRDADRADRALNQQDAYHKLQLQQMADARAATQHQQDFQAGEKLNEAIPGGTTFPTVDRMAAPSQAPVMGRLQMVGALQPTAGTLSSTTDTPANAATGTPPLGRLTAIPEGQIKLPSAGQQNILADNARADAVAAREAANQPLEDVVDANAPGGHTNVPRAQAVGKTKYHVPPSSTSNPTDAAAIADAIESGIQPPDTRGLFRLAGPVRAELAKRGYDLATANLDWQATQKHLASLNGPQQTRLRQAIGSATDSLDIIQNLANQWDAGRFPILNRANLALAKNGAYGKDAASIATQLEVQITDVTSELGNVYMGGNTPTDHALALAQKNLSADWDRKVLTDMIGLARKNLQIRQNSITNAGAITQSSQDKAAQPKANDPMGIR